MRSFREEQGQVLVTTLCCMGILLGALGLAVDVGVLFHARRNMQTAADAAAMAGATELFYNGPANVTAVADAAAKNNGVDNTVSGNSVIVTIAPSLPVGASCASCVGVQLSTPNPTIFMATLGQFFFQSGNYNSINVSAMAVAGAPSASQTCMYVMDPVDPDTLSIQSGGDVYAPGCTAYVNSNNGSALCVAGASTLNNFEVVGGQDSGCTGNPEPPVFTGTGVQGPPLLSNLPANPTANCATTDTTTTILSGQVAGPGYGTYSCYANVVNLSSATLGPGIYVFESGVTVSGATVVGNGTGTVTSAGGGATIVIATGAFSSSGANLTIYAPTSGPYNGVAIYQPSTDVAPMTLQFGGTGSYFMGAVVAPTSAVTVLDPGGDINAAPLIVGQLQVPGTLNGAANTVTLANYNAYNAATTPFNKITLVE